MKLRPSAILALWAAWAVWGSAAAGTVAGAECDSTGEGCAATEAEEVSLLAMRGHRKAGQGPVPHAQEFLEVGSLDPSGVTMEDPNKARMPKTYRLLLFLESCLSGKLGNLAIPLFQVCYDDSVCFDSNTTVGGISLPDMWVLHNMRVAKEMTPVAIVFPKTPEQAAAAVKCAVASGINVQGQSGRHAYEAYCTSCILINAHYLKRTDFVKRGDKQQAWLGAGLNLGQVYTNLTNKNYTIPGGTCPTVGIAGLTLGGGKGILTRTEGLLIDKLAGIEAVLPNGTIVVANATLNEDLYWMARGSGGNSFPGFVTAFLFDLVNVPSNVVEVSGVWPMLKGNCSHGLVTPNDTHTCEDFGRKVFQVWQDEYMQHPDWRVYVRLTLHPYADVGPVPSVMLDFKFLGMSRSQARAYLLPAVELLGTPPGARPLNESMTSTSYIQSVMNGGGIGYYGGYMDGNVPVSYDDNCPTYIGTMGGLTHEQAVAETVRDLPPFCSWDGQFNTNMKYRSLVMNKLNKQAIETLMSTVIQAPAFDSDKVASNFYLQIDPSNGFAGTVDPTATAYPWRGMDHMTLQVIAKWNSWSANAYVMNTGQEVDPTLEGFNFLVVSRMMPYVGYRAYYNYIDKDMPGGTLPKDAYWGANVERIKEIRERYADPRRPTGNEWELAVLRPGMTFHDSSIV